MDDAIAGELTIRLAVLRAELEQVEVELSRIQDLDERYDQREILVDPLITEIENLAFVCEGKKPSIVSPILRPPSTMTPLEIWMDNHSYGVVEEAHDQARQRVITVIAAGDPLYARHYSRADIRPGIISAATFVGEPETETLIAVAVEGKYPGETKDLHLDFYCDGLFGLLNVVSAATEVYENMDMGSVGITAEANNVLSDEKRQLEIEIERILAPMLEHMKEDPDRVRVLHPGNANQIRQAEREILEARAAHPDPPALAVRPRVTPLPPGHPIALSQIPRTSVTRIRGM